MRKGIIYIILLTFSQMSFSTTISVSSIVALQSAVTTASAGDTIILADGTYLNTTLTLGTSNITIQSTTPGGVFLNGTNAISITGNYITFSGFQFTSGTITSSAITVNGSNNTLTQLNFNGYDATHMIIISGSYNLVTNCNFQNKPATNLVNHGGTGDMVQIIPNATIVGYNTIRYCSFQHMPGFGGDYGNECIRIGDGAYATDISRTVVEYCYFEDTGNGDSEAISVKSRENVLRFNTMNNNPNAMFSFRNGDNNVAYSNFFIRSGGIRCKESNNIFCYNNYFEQSGINQNTTLPGSGTAPISLEYYGTGYGNNFNMIHNTFYKCISSPIGTGLTNCTWANNIFYSDSGTLFYGTASGQSFAGNLYQGTLGIVIPSGMNNIDPLLTLSPNGYYVLSATSPAIGAASSSYPSILDLPTLANDSSLLKDFEGQDRPALITAKDVGCDQYSTETIINHPLTLCDVGPTYLCTALSVTIVANEKKALVLFPNPVNDTILHIANLEQASDYRILNMMGQEVGNGKIENKGTIIVENLTSGNYLIQIGNENGTTTKCFIKQ